MARQSRQSFCWLALGLCLLSGCALNRPSVDQALLADGGRTDREAGVAENYLVECPDVLEVTVDRRPQLPAGQQTIGPDGCIDMGSLGRLRVDGHTRSQVASIIAASARVPTSWVHISVAEYNSQQIYIYGQVKGLQRAVSYRGQETVLDLLQRVGGIAPGAEPSRVYVVRSRISEGQRPEIYPVNLQDIVLKKDQQTNVRLEPSDQVYIGETKQSSLEKVVPPCLRPVYQKLCGMPVHIRLPTPPPAPRQ